MTESGPVAFVCAMPMELRPLAKQLRLASKSYGELSVLAGELGGQPVVAHVTGMGTKLAAEGTTNLLDAVHPSRVVVFGITGAVTAETQLGTLAFPEVVIDAATGRAHRHEPLGLGEHRGVLWTTDVITTAAELPALLERGVVALDMETASVAHVCEQRGVPWCVIRAYSDRATDGSVDDELFHLSKQDGTPDPKAVVRYVLRHPRKIPQLARMGAAANKATQAAASAAIAAVRGSATS